MSDLPDVNDLLKSAPVSDAASESLQKTVSEHGSDVDAMQGVVAADDIDSDTVVLMTLIVDDSTSIRNAGNEQNVRDGHNLIVDAMRNSEQSNDIVVSCVYLNNARGTDSGVRYPYTDLQNVEELTDQNYRPSGLTPLFDRVATALTGAVAKMEEFEGRGVAVRAITGIITDGADQHSRVHTAETVRAIIVDQRQSERHIIAGIGIEDPSASHDFKSIFKSMGIHEDWILTPGSTASEIREAFNVFSIRAMQYSQGSDDAYATTLINDLGGGFTTQT